MWEIQGHIDSHGGICTFGDALSSSNENMSGDKAFDDRHTHISISGDGSDIKLADQAAIPFEAEALAEQKPKIPILTVKTICTDAPKAWHGTNLASIQWISLSLSPMYSIPTLSSRGITITLNKIIQVINSFI